MGMGRGRGTSLWDSGTTSAIMVKKREMATAEPPPIRRKMLPSQKIRMSSESLKCPGLYLSAVLFHFQKADPSKFLKSRK